MRDSYGGENLSEDLLKMNGLSTKLLASLSYPVADGISLKRTLRSVSKELLLQDVISMTEWLDRQEILQQLSLDYRIKSVDSIEDKYCRYLDSGRPIRKVFNDILGFRAFCWDYASVLVINIPNFRVVDMSGGKSHDDGYRGVHVYFQLDGRHYPIEIQFNTFYDRQLNNWLHDYLYKQEDSNFVGQQLRIYYEEGKIRNESDFQEALKHVLSNR